MAEFIGSSGAKPLDNNPQQRCTGFV